MNICIYCEKQLSSKHALHRHQNICKEALHQRCDDQREQYEAQLLNQREQYEAQLLNQREQYEAQLLNQFEQHQKQLEEQKIQYEKRIEKLEDKLFEIAKQPKNITNNTTTTQTHNNRNTNIINQLAIYDLTQDQITQLLTQHYNLETFHGGPEEIAKLAARFLLTDAQSQKPKVACTDLSRKNFKYVDEEQEVQVDPGFQKTHDLIKEPLSKANIRVYVDELQKDDKYHDQWRKNEEFISDRTGFSDKVIKWMV
jgi:hypothetical protein